MTSAVVDVEIVRVLFHLSSHGTLCLLQWCVLFSTVIKDEERLTHHLCAADVWLLFAAIKNFWKCLFKVFTEFIQEINTNTNVSVGLFPTLSVQNFSLVCSVAIYCVGDYSKFVHHTQTHRYSQRWSGTGIFCAASWTLFWSSSGRLHSEKQWSWSPPSPSLLYSAETQENKMEDRQTSEEMDWQHTVCTILSLLNN